MQQTKQGARAKLPMLEVLIFFFNIFLLCIYGMVGVRYGLFIFRISYFWDHTCVCAGRVRECLGAQRRTRHTWRNEKQVPSFRQVECIRICICICAVAPNKRITS